MKKAGPFLERGDPHPSWGDLEDRQERFDMVEAADIVNLFYRNAKLGKMAFCHSTFKVKKVVSQFSGIQHDVSSAILALNRNSIVNLRSVLPILVSTILTNEFKFDVHIFSENELTFWDNSDEVYMEGGCQPKLRRGPAIMARTLLLPNLSSVWGGNFNGEGLLHGERGRGILKR